MDLGKLSNEKKEILIKDLLMKGKLSSINQKLSALEYICEILNENNVDYYISGGTCLGIYRDNELIPWDDDIDIDVIGRKSYKEIESVIEKKLLIDNYPYVKGINKFHPKISMFIDNVKVSVVELSPGFFDKDKLFRPKYKVPIKYLLPLKEFEFQDILLKIPRNTEKYLSHLYGESWRNKIRWEDNDQNQYYAKDYILRSSFYKYLEIFQNFICSGKIR